MKIPNTHKFAMPDEIERLRVERDAALDLAAWRLTEMKFLEGRLSSALEELEKLRGSECFNTDCPIYDQDHYHGGAISKLRAELDEVKVSREEMLEFCTAVQKQDCERQKELEQEARELEVALSVEKEYTYNLKQQLAQSQAREAELRAALEDVRGFVRSKGYDTRLADTALASDGSQTLEFIRKAAKALEIVKRHGHDPKREDPRIHVSDVLIERAIKSKPEWL